MARFEEQQLGEIRSRLDIVSFIGRYVALKPAGRSFLGLCPFHQEKTPSFNVHREKQFFHCFGCKESGDIFDFAMKHEHLSFPEAVERLAQEAGVKLEERSPSESRAETERREKEAAYFRANTIAAEYFAQSLRAPQAKGAVAYLQKRGITGKMAKHFFLGYSPSQWDGLLQYLHQQGITAQAAVTAGLAVQREGREPFDLFRNRVMFPITDLRGRIIAFGGRSVTGDNPKYLNTPQTDFFSKREHLYGLTQARSAARRDGFVIVCEGYTDVIALAQYGIDNAVASLGTAFTSEQARILSRLSDEVVLAFDGDTAGRSATDRGLDLLRDAGLSVRVAVLPEGQDPDTFVRAKGREGFLRQLESAMSLTEYKIEEALTTADLFSVEGRAQAVDAVLPVLASVKSPVAREAYIAQIASRVGSTSQAVVDALAQFLGRDSRRTGDRHRIERSRYTTIDPSQGERVGPTRQAHRVTSSRGPRQGRVAALDERTMLRILVQEPEHIGRVHTILGERPFTTDDHNLLFAALHQVAAGHTRLEELSPQIGAAIHELLSWEPAVVLEIDTYIERLWEQQMSRKLHRLEVELARLPERDENAYAEHVGSLLLAYKRLRQAIRRHSTTSR